MESVFNLSDLVDLLVTAAGETGVASTFQAAFATVRELLSSLLGFLGGSR